MQGHRAGTLRAPYDYHKSLRSFSGQNDNLEPCVVLMITVRCPYGDRTMSLECVYGLRAYNFFQICHCAELNKIVEATMPVNLYDYRKVSLRRTHRNGDLDIVGASYTRCKSNVTEALDLRFLALNFFLGNMGDARETTNCNFMCSFLSCFQQLTLVIFSLYLVKHMQQDRAYPGSEFVVANTLAKWKSLEPNENNLSKGFSQKVV